MSKKPAREARSPIETGALDALGSARSHWDAFLAAASGAAPEVNVVWKEYAGKTGRQCVIRMEDRNLAYLKPGEGWFLVSVALSDAAVAGLGESKLPKALIKEIEGAPKYPEGRPARVQVDSAATLKTALALLAIKAADVVETKSKRR